MTYAHRPNTMEANPMTVCVAAIFDNASVFGASDRMLTGGDIEFQPAQAKIWPVTNSISVMTAGDISVHAEILRDINGLVAHKLQKEPQRWISVKEVAETYGTIYSTIRHARFEREVLLPMGLNSETLISRQKEMAQSFVSEMTTRASRFCIPDIATLVVGVDEIGPHIYIVENAEVSCNDTVGFAAVGAGRWHSTSQFMSSGYTRSTAASRALIITHRAKRKAEVAPGVGRHTDMFMIGPKPGSFHNIPSLMLKDLDRAYDKYCRDIEKADNASEKRFSEMLVKRLAVSKQLEQQATAETKSESQPPAKPANAPST